MVGWAKSLNDEYLNEQQYRMNQVIYLLTMVRKKGGEGGREEGRARKRKKVAEAHIYLFILFFFSTKTGDCHVPARSIPDRRLWHECTYFFYLLWRFLLFFFCLFFLLAQAILLRSLPLPIKPGPLCFLNKFSLSLPSSLFTNCSSSTSPSSSPRTAS